MVEMDSTGEKKRKFYNAPSKCTLEILKVKGTIHESDIVINISPYNEKYYIDVDIANQL